MKKIEIKKLFTKSFKIYKENWFNFLLIGILLGLISLVSHFSGLGINQTTGELVFGTSAIVAIIAWFVSTYLSVGVIRYTLDLIDGKKVKLKRIFYGIDSIEHMVYVVLVALITTVLVL